MTKKKYYQKPEVKKVALVPEEAVLVNCKTTSGTVKNAARCRSGSCPTGFPRGS